MDENLSHLLPNKQPIARSEGLQVQMETDLAVLLYG